MAYTNPTGTKLGQVNNAGAVDALFKTTFWGLVLRAYEENRFISPLLRHKTAIRGEKAKSFRLLGQAVAKYHARGESIQNSGDGTNSDPANGGYLSEVAQAEAVINLSDTLLAATTVYELDEIKNEYSEKQALAAELGRQLANADERYAIQALAAAATRSSDLYTGEPAAGGTKDITGWAALTEAQKQTAVYDAFFEAKTLFDKANIPDGERYFTCHPDYEPFVTKNLTVLNKDWGGLGSVADGTAPRLAGFRVNMSTIFPSGNQAQEAGEKNSLGFDFTDHMGVFWTPDAAGRVSGMPMQTSITWQEDFLHWLFMSRMAVGHGPVRRECARLLKKTDA